MKKGNGAKKGSLFERQICKQLSLWWTDNGRDDVFWRTAGSGSRATNRAKQGMATAGAYGDLTYTDAIGEPLLRVCCFELKRGYGKWDLLDLIDRLANAKDSMAERFWQQASRSAMDAGVEFPFVIFRRNMRQAGIMSKALFMSRMKMYAGAFEYPFITAAIGGDLVHVARLADWLEYIDPEFIRRLV